MRRARLALLLCLLLGCSSESDRHRDDDDDDDRSSKKKKDEPAPPDPLETLMAIPTLVGAIDATKKTMSDEVDDLSGGAVALAVWAAEKMRWSELSGIPESGYGLIMKDPDAERGKRLCGTGEIIEIEAEKTDFGKVFRGGMFAGGIDKVFRFLAVGSTGDLVAHSRAKFCGIVIGKESYSNSMGGMTHGVSLVGMFDLPANRVYP